jgi:hypothetical protein
VSRPSTRSEPNLSPYRDEEILKGLGTIAVDIRRVVVTNAGVKSNHTYYDDTSAAKVFHEQVRPHVRNPLVRMRTQPAVEEGPAQSHHGVRTAPLTKVSSTVAPRLGAARRVSSRGSSSAVTAIDEAPFVEFVFSCACTSALLGGRC